jgi:hypothetical protein
MYWLLLCCSMVIVSYPLAAQETVVRMDRAGSNPEEVAIAINPQNPDNLIAGANLRYYFYSFDGGKTWEQKQLPSGTWGDPSVLFDKTGRAYIANLVYGWDAIVVRHSDDGGVTWSEPAKLYGPSSDSAKVGSLFNSSLQDKEWLATDLSDGPYGGYIYAGWTDFTKYGSESPNDSSVIVFARSTDRGESFEPFVRVSDKGGNAVDSDETVEGAVPAVGPDGGIYMAWSGPEGLYFDRSFDAGLTWGEDNIIADQPGGWDFSISGINSSNGLPITAADISESPYRGTIYVNWIDSRNGDPDVFIARSTDKGDSWSDPIRVNDDTIGNGKAQFFTWLAVDPLTGELSVVFHDRRRYSGDSTDVYLARSTDGGMTFENKRISSASFYPTPFVFFGDYNGIASYGGRIRPIWTQLDQGELSIYTALIDDETVSVEGLPLARSGIALRQYPNPVSSVSGSAVTFQVHTREAGSLQLRVYDIMGREVASVTETEMAAGMIDIHWDSAALEAGVYICRALLQHAGTARMATHMMTVLK